MTEQFIEPFSIVEYTAENGKQLCCLFRNEIDTNIETEWDNIISESNLQNDMYVLIGEKDDNNILSITALVSTLTGNCLSRSRVINMINRYKDNNVVNYIKVSDEYNENRKALIIYHKDDNDGVVSGALAAYYLMYCKGISRDNINMCGTDYNSIKSITEPLIHTVYTQTYDYVIMTDISVSVELLHTFHKIIGPKFLWFDHHAPIVEAAMAASINKYIPGTRVTGGCSALKLVFDYINHTNNTIIPYTDALGSWIEALSQWDSWSYTPENKEKARNINKGTTARLCLDINKVLDIFCENLTDYMSISHKFLYDIEETGKILNEQEDARYERLVSEWGDTSFVIDNNGELRTCCVLFIQEQTNSLMFKSCKQQHGIVFKRRPNSNWSVSIYNTDSAYDTEFHCGNYARVKYNGGGHPGAAGFEITEEQFFNILKSKTI